MLAQHGRRYRRAHSYAMSGLPVLTALAAV
eukprot:COSAG06_NODE_23789_length_681_cov_1.304124_2_plen_29_part_01